MRHGVSINTSATCCNTVFTKEPSVIEEAVGVHCKPDFCSITVYPPNNQDITLKLVQVCKYLLEYPHIIVIHVTALN